LANPGDITVNNVVVTHTLPNEMSLLGSDPPGRALGNRVEWTLPQIHPGMVVEINVSCTAVSGGDVQHLFSARCDEGIVAEAAALTRIFQNALVLRANGPVAAQVGQSLTYEISVSNVGGQPLTNVMVVDQLGPGLAHETNVPKIERPLGTLAAGQSERFAVTLSATAAGELCQNLSVTADGGHHASTRVCVNATAAGSAPAAPPVPPKPAMSIEVTGRPEARVGDVTPFSIRVTNTGTATLNNVQVLAMGDDVLVPSVASQGFFPSEQGIFWTIKELPVGYKVDMYVHSRCAKASANACQRVAAACDELSQRVESACLNIKPALGSGPGGANRPTDAPDEPAAPRPSAGPADSGTLEITMTSLDNPIYVGAPTTYLVLVRNGRAASDQDVTLTLRLPAALRFERLVSG
ncbi:MAG: DUF11 domain-containing protein, partial [Planctomycetales bacterium]|nr:DUF11 domain-containing protein [Planctomycetales bacterium]